MSEYSTLYVDQQSARRCETLQSVVQSHLREKNSTNDVLMHCEVQIKCKTVQIKRVYSVWQIIIFHAYKLEFAECDLPTKTAKERCSCFSVLICP